MSSVLEREPRRGQGSGAAAAESAGGAVSELLSIGWVQLAGGVLAAVLAPALLGGAGRGPSPALPASLAATLLGYAMMRQMRAHPGVRSAGYVLYAFALAYAGAGLVLLLAQTRSADGQLLPSFALTAGWFLAADRATGKGAIRRLAYVPGAPAAALPRAPWVVWRRLESPEADLQGVSGVVADLAGELSPEWERFLARCALGGLPVYDLRQMGEQLTGRVKLEHLSENTLSSGLVRIAYARVKRLVDLAAGLLAAPVVLPLVAVAAALVKLESPGPALFRQVRMGHRGRPFTIYKLRSMRADAHAGALFTGQDDPRVTRVGAFIRRYRIDELPQLWNILKGEMSWIGPRPEAAELAAWYEREAPFYCYRHMVRPGLTGWAQVNQGNVAGPEAATEKLHYDFYYIKNLSLWLDLLIAAKTIRTVLTGFGSR